MKIKIQKKTSLLEALQQINPESSKNNLKSWVRQGRVFINETRIRSWNKELLPGQEVKIGPRLSFIDEGIKILYKDRYLVVIDKPEKLLTVATDKESLTNVHTILKNHLGGPVFPVHRLDREASGVLVFAYTKQAQELLKTQFANHTIERIYYAYLEGSLPSRKGTWRSYLVEDKNYFVRTCNQGGKLAITHYEVITQKKGLSLVQFKLETGRKNQIRVQAAEAGYPILGDVKYGSKKQPSTRLCLHAHLLEFEHPFLKKNYNSFPLFPLFLPPLIYRNEVSKSTGKHRYTEES